MKRTDLPADHLAALRAAERDRQRLHRQRKRDGIATPRPRRHTITDANPLRDDERECPVCRRAFRFGGNGHLAVFCAPSCADDPAVRLALRTFPSLLAITDADDFVWRLESAVTDAAALAAARRTILNAADELLDRWGYLDAGHAADLRAALAGMGVDVDALVARRRRANQLARAAAAYRTRRTRGRDADELLLADMLADGMSRDAALALIAKINANADVAAPRMDGDVARWD